MFIVKVPKLIKLQKPVEVFEHVGPLKPYEQPSSFNHDQSTNDITGLIVEGDILAKSMISCSRSTPVTVPQVMRVDAQRYAEKVHSDNEMLFNRKQHILRQFNAKNHKLRALAHELTKVEHRTDTMITDFKQHRQDMMSIKEAKAEHDLVMHKLSLKDRFEALEQQIAEAHLDEGSQYSHEPPELTYSQLNRELEHGFVKNEELYDEVDRLQGWLDSISEIEIEPNYDQMPSQLSKAMPAKEMPQVLSKIQAKNQTKKAMPNKAIPIRSKGQVPLRKPNPGKR